MRYQSLILALVVIGCTTSCVSRGQNQQPSHSRPEEATAVLRSVSAVLNEETHPAVRAVETKIKGKAGALFEFKRAQFVDDNHGWAMSEGSLYRTADAGKTWERLAHEPEKDSRFSAFFFVDASHGWLAVVKHSFTENYLLGHSSVIMTTEDGGVSWKPQASFPNEVKITEIRFFNKIEGFAVGAHVMQSKLQPHDELLVLRSSNGGNDWTDISDAAKTAIKEDDGIPDEYGQHIEWTPSSIFLLTRFGRIIKTTDSGKTWKRVAVLKREQSNGIVSSAGYIKLALDPPARLRIVAAAPGGDYIGDFVLQEDGRWTSYQLDLMPILDAVFLSEKEVVACGLDRRPLHDKPNADRKEGVILRSFDSGKSWQSIYHSKSHETFFFITRVKDNHFYAVSDIGTFLRFNLTQ